MLFSPIVKYFGRYKLLTVMNKKNIQLYRILVAFGGDTSASFLPRILKLSLMSRSDKFT